MIINLIYIKNVFYYVKNVIFKEMKQITIVMNVKEIIYFLMSLLLINIIVFINVIYIILIKFKNIFVLINVLKNILKLLHKRKNVLMNVKTMRNIYMIIIILVLKNVQMIQKLILKKINVQNHVMNINLSLIILAFQIALMILLDYIIIEIYVLMKYQKIIIQIRVIIYLNNVLTLVKNVMVKEMK